MRYRVVLVCNRCGQHRGVVARTEAVKKRGYRRKCVAFLCGEIEENQAPALRAGLTRVSGWVAQK
jgi:hypothetical protein